jgi:3',5'-cyclic AMP phosphodiesterase CpdA
VAAAVSGGFAAVARTSSERTRADVAPFLTTPAGGPATTARTEPSAAPPLVRLAVAGDVGTGGSSEYATAAAMDRAERSRQFDALVLLGDNVYPSGDPARLDATVLRPFRAVLDGDTQLFAALGNHDVKTGDGDGQVAALGMPDRWYARHLGSVLVVVLDSTRGDDPAQRAWLEETLANATEPWKIIAMHHPPYSAGWHGSNETVRDAFSPLFERYGVQLVLSGHDHDYQRSKPVNGVTYVVSGGAATLRETGSAQFTAASRSTYHFVDVAARDDRLEVRAIQQDGRVFDAVTLAR